jgi:hypothetical protein
MISPSSLLADNGWLSNCCNAGVHRDTELCLSCGEHCEAVCEFCEVEEGDTHVCSECGWEFDSEKQCHDQNGLCNSCLFLLDK